MKVPSRKEATAVATTHALAATALTSAALTAVAFAAAIAASITAAAHTAAADYNSDVKMTRPTTCLRTLAPTGTARQQRGRRSISNSGNCRTARWR